MSLGDLKYIPGIAFGVVVLVGVLGMIALGAIAFVITEPEVLVVGLLLLGAARAWSAIEESRRCRSQ